jgi:hypothetical protein
MWLFFKYDFRGLMEGFNKAGWIAFFISILIQIILYIFHSFNYESPKHAIAYNIGGVVINALIVALLAHIISSIFTKPYPDKKK